MINPTPEPTPAPVTPAAQPTRWRDVLLLLFSLLAILVLLGRGIYLVVQGFTLGGPNSSSMLPMYIYGAVSMLFCALLLMPLLVLTLRRLQGAVLTDARVPPVKIWQIIVLIVIWVLAIVFSSLVTGLFQAGWVVAAPLFLLGIALPVVILLWIAVGGLPTGSWRRLWATLGLGMTLSTSIAIVLELLFVGVALAIAGVVASLNPALLASLQQLRSQITNTNNVQDLLPLLSPYLNNPLVFLAVLFFVSGVGPLIEEAFKPLAVWLVGKRLHTPAEGFALGALCGAGFALLEGMLVTSNATDMLGVSLAARATSSLMHITASAFMGWGIASAVLEKRYGRLALIYLLSVMLHGMWNGAVVLTVYGGLRLSLQGSGLDALGGLTAATGIGLLVILVIAILACLPIINRLLRRGQPARNDIIAPTIS